ICDDDDVEEEQDSSLIGPEIIKAQIIVLLKKSKWTSAIGLYRRNKSLLSLGSGPSSDEEDVGNLLNMYASTLRKNQE
ncbi:Hypothetical protein FKW44_008792, partial [Caligus rogercresseyi]